MIGEEEGRNKNETHIFPVRLARETEWKQIKKQFSQTRADQCQTVYFSLECSCISPKQRSDYPGHRTWAEIQQGAPLQNQLWLSPDNFDWPPI